MKTGTIVAIILATAGAVIATVAFMQRKRKHAFCIDDEGPDCFADDSDAYCCEEAEDGTCCSDCACDADACTDADTCTVDEEEPASTNADAEPEKSSDSE